MDEINAVEYSKILDFLAKEKVSSWNTDIYRSNKAKFLRLAMGTLVNHNNCKKYNNNRY